MFTATMWCDIELGDVASLKAKRSVVRPIVAELRRRFDVAAAEVGANELYRRSEIGVAAVASTAGQVGAVIDACERFVAGRPEVVLLSIRRQLLAHTDDPPMTRPDPVGNEESFDG